MVLRHHELLGVVLWRITKGKPVRTTGVIVIIVGVAVHARETIIVLRCLRLVVK
jgi:hypothetical protein